MRRMLLAGAITGLAAGIVGQAAVDGSAHGEIEWLVRAALVLPTLVFLLWWLLVPGISLEEPGAAVATPIEAGERLERIEATFDATAVPRARREGLLPVGDAARSTYRGSIRVSGAPVQTGALAPSFGVRRPDAAERDTGS